MVCQHKSDAFRMHYNGLRPGQIIAKCQSFPNTYAAGESRPFGRENLFSPKKHLKPPFLGELWEDLDAKLLTPSQWLGFPGKFWGIKVQTSYWEGQWHQNWVRSRLKNFFTKTKWKFARKKIYSSASSSKTKRDIGMGPSGDRYE